MQFNGGATGGLLFPLQQLMSVYGPSGPINSWIFNKAGANIDTATNLAAINHLDGWIKDGYFNQDANATDYPTMMSKFMHGDGLLIFDGDWESGNFDSHMKGKVGFPDAAANSRRKYAAMSAPLSYGIAAKGPCDCAAFFLNWVATNPKARALNVAVGGPTGGPPSLRSRPEAGVGDTDTRCRQARREDNGAMDFIANATSNLRTELDAGGPEAVRRSGPLQTC